jgi:hypothetical protein
MVKQAEIAQMTRKKDEQLRRYMRLFDLRREAYIRLLDVTAEVVRHGARIRWYRNVLRTNGANTEVDEALQAVIPPISDQAEWLTVTQELEAAKKLQETAQKGVRSAMESIALLAPREVIYAATALESESFYANREGFDDQEYYRLARARFILKAREDLGLPADEISERIEKRWREAPNLMQRLQERRARVSADRESASAPDASVVDESELLDRLRADAEQESEGAGD